MILQTIWFTIALIFGCAWGAAENRVWKEAGEHWIADHFKLYHVLMGLLFGTLNAAIVCIIYNNTFTQDGALLWFWLMHWDTLLLDVVWWYIRYMDITHLGEYAMFGPFMLWMYPLDNEYDYGKGEAWHTRPDWDNAPIFGWKPPLIGIGKYKCYWWWWVFSFNMIVIGLIIILL